MTPSERLRALAAQEGFRPDAVEKVQKLVGILVRLDRHEAAEGMWLLKGGTALNLFHLPLPRLSVDIDVNFVGEERVEALRDARSRFENALASCCEREGCTVRRAPTEHAGGKFRLRFASALGGTQNLEIDVSYVARVPLFDSERRRAVIPFAMEDVATPLVSLPELVAGKFAALASRNAVRDQFDAASILDERPDVVTTPSFRTAFVCFAATQRNDCRKLRGAIAPLEPRDVEQRLVPLLRVRPGAPMASVTELTARLRNTVVPAIAAAVAWSDPEREFLDRFLDAGEIRPALLTEDPVLHSRILRQPMLLWKQRYILDRQR